MKRLFTIFLFIFIVFTLLTTIIFMDTKTISVSKEYTPLLNSISILVNKSISLPDDYIPDNLVRINSKYADRDLYLVKEANTNLEKMLDEAKSNNLDIRVISAYRSYDYQKNLYNKYYKKDGDLANTYSAKAGHSEHQTGLCIDIDNRKTNYENFASTEEYKWMIDNSYKYGFILRYPENKESITGYQYESWHYRYVGKEIATYIHKHNITFDEYYYEFIQNKNED